MKKIASHLYILLKEKSLQSLILGDIDLEEKRCDSHCIITFPLTNLQ